MNLHKLISDHRKTVTVSLSGHTLGHLRAPVAWDTGERRLDQHLLYLVTRGGFQLTSAGMTFDLRSGDLALIPPETSFRARWTGGPRPTFWRLRLTLPTTWDGPLVTAGCHDCEPLVALLVGEATHRQAFHDERVRGLLLALLAQLTRRAGDTPAHRLPVAQCTLLERYADAHDEATPRDLARQLELTLDYFTRLFGRTYGRPPRRWLLERRMQHAAAQVAESDLPIERIAADLGFADARLFGRQFRAVLGQPPGRFRSSVRGAS